MRGDKASHAGAMARRIGPTARVIANKLAARRDVDAWQDAASQIRVPAINPAVDDGDHHVLALTDVMGAFEVKKVDVPLCIANRICNRRARLI